MTFKVTRAFRHKNTGKLWRVGEAFDGTETQARELARKGFVAESGGFPEKRGPLDAEAAPEPAGGEAGSKPLADMTVRELVAICARERIETPGKPKKAELVAAIEAAREGGE